MSYVGWIVTAIVAIALVAFLIHSSVTCSTFPINWCVAHVG